MLLLAGPAQAAPVAATIVGGTLDAVRKSGTLTCGVIADEDDYSEADTHGNLSALGADYCRALSAEIFADIRKARFRTLPDEPAGLAALRDHTVDVLFGATPNPVIGGVYRVVYGPPLFLDGQGFLADNRRGIHHAADLAGHNVCFINAAPPEQGLYDALEPGLKTPERRFPYSERGEMEIALLDGHCDAITGDISLMANVRASFGKRASGFTVLPDTVSTDPFSPVTRAGDPQWSALVDWTVWALLQAEAHGLDHANLEAARTSEDPVARRLAGATPWIGRALGVSDDAFAHAIASVGNYGEVFDRDVGQTSALELARGRNRLMEQGGAFWALPVEPLQ
jgi:general L-amino acid transport system substrate-binding protein